MESIESSKQADPELVYVSGTARIAVYDDFKSAPRILEITPDETGKYIEAMASTTYEASHTAGGSLPYSAIREVCENLIHARFTEIVISIYDRGNTIRFTDQGPGIVDKQHAVLPGFTTATEQMKKHIAGVGSGLPRVKEYLDYSNGYLSIDDNLNTGAVITLSLNPIVKNAPLDLPVTAQQQPATATSADTSALTTKEIAILAVFKNKPSSTVKEISIETGMAVSTVHYNLNKLQNAGFLTVTADKERVLTAEGSQVVSEL